MIRLFIVLAAAFFAALAFAAIVNAQSTAAATDVVREAKADCTLGEQIDGYLGDVSGGASAAVRAAMDEVNIRRRAVYRDLAEREGVALDVIARLAGERQVRNTPEGQCFLDDSGQWKTQ